MKKEIISIRFEVCIPFGSPLTPCIRELPDITTKKDLIRNYNKAKKYYSSLKIKSKITIMVKEKCRYCKGIVDTYYSLRKLKELFDLKLTKKRK